MKKADTQADRTVLEKRRLRRLLQSERDALSAQERVRADERILQALCAAAGFGEAGLVLSYRSFGSEVDTAHIIERALRDGKRVALPRISGPGAMDWHEVDSLDGLVMSGAGILEPVGSPASKVDPFAASGGSRLALVPGIAFDAQGRRLGYGGGFYDRFLCGFKESGGLAWGLGRVGQVREKALPQDVHDVRVDAIVTEEGIRSCSMVPAR